MRVIIPGTLHTWSNPDPEPRRSLSRFCLSIAFAAPLSETALFQFIWQAGLRTNALFYAVPLGGNHTVVNHKT